MSDLISIIIPLYNREELIKDTLNSVSKQTDKNWECIIVDDHSTDNSIEVVKEFIKDDQRFKLFTRDSEVKGASVCRNIGVKQSEGTFLMFLDSDDLLDSNCIYQRKAYLDSDFDFLVFPMKYFKQDTSDMNVLHNINTEERPLDRFLKRENVWLNGMVLWKKSFFLSVGGFNEKCLSFQDWEIHVKGLIHSDRFIFHDKLKPDIYYRLHNASISGKRYSSEHYFSQAQMTLDIYRQLKLSDKYSVKRHKNLVFFFIKSLLANRFEKKSGAIKEKVLEFSTCAVEQRFIKPYDKYLILNYFNLSVSKIFNKVKPLRKAANFIFFSVFLAKYNFKHSSLHGKIKHV